MLVRAIALSLALLIGIGAIIPLATDNAEAGPKHRKHTKSSKKVQEIFESAGGGSITRGERARRALQARKRALRLRQLRLARKHTAQNE